MTGPGGPDADSFLAAALGSMPHGFSIWNDDLRLMLFNQHYMDLYRFPAGSMRPGMSLLDVCKVSIDLGNHPEGSAEDLAALYNTRFEATMAPGSRRIFEKRIKGRVLKITHIRTIGLGWTVVHEDVTAEVEAAKLVREREERLTLQNMRFSAAVDNMRHGLCMFDAEGRMVICNEPYARMYGLTPEMTAPGTPIEAILRHVYAGGMVPRIGEKAYIDACTGMMAQRGRMRDVVEMRDGRIIAVEHTPMADGGGVATHEDITERRRTEARIQHLARHDMLTDLPNRMYFAEEMKRAEVHIEADKHVAVLAVDLDHFKAVNDNGGHAMGDAVLVEAARRLREATRRTDMVARLGGDEFVVLVNPLRGIGEAEAVAARVVTHLSEPFAVNGQTLYVGGSVGIAIAPADGMDATTLMRHADLALYRAKREGRGCYRFYSTPEDDQRLLA